MRTATQEEVEFLFQFGSSSRLIESWQANFRQDMAVATAVFNKVLRRSQSRHTHAISQILARYWELPKHIQLSFLKDPIFCYAMRNFISSSGIELGNVVQADVDLLLRCFLSKHLEYDQSLFSGHEFVLKLNDAQINLPGWSSPINLKITGNATNQVVLLAASNKLCVIDGSVNATSRDVSLPVGKYGQRRLLGGSIYGDDLWYAERIIEVAQRYGFHPDNPVNSGDLLGTFDPAQQQSCADTVDQALSVFSLAAPNVLQDIGLFTRVIVPFNPNPYFGGFSINGVRGAIFVTRESNIVDMLDRIIHESTHNKLDTFDDLFPLLEPMGDAMFPSPWRSDPRPMEGVVHGAYTFYIVSCALEIVASALPEQTEFIMNRVNRYRAQVAEALKTIKSAAKLTETGSQVFHNLGNRIL